MVTTTHSVGWCCTACLRIEPVAVHAFLAAFETLDSLLESYVSELAASPASPASVSFAGPEGGNSHDMSTATKGTGVFQPRYGLMAQQEKKSQHSSTKSSCEPTDSAMTPIVLAMQQQLHLQQMQRGARGHARRSSVCSNSSTCVSSGSFASGGSLSPAAAGSPLLSPCHSSSLSALASPFATSSVNCIHSFMLHL